MPAMRRARLYSSSAYNLHTHVHRADSQYTTHHIVCVCVRVARFFSFYGHFEVAHRKTTEKLQVEHEMISG